MVSLMVKQHVKDSARLSGKDAGCASAITSLRVNILLFLRISTTTPNFKSIKKVKVYISCLF